MQSSWLGVLRGAALLALLLAAPVARAQDAVFWFAHPADDTGTPIQTLAIAGNGTPFTVAVWYQSPTALPHFAANVFVGFDRTDTVGVDAVPKDQSIGLNGDALAAISGVGPDFTLGSPALGGGQGLEGIDRPYGIDVPLEAPLGQFLTGEEPTKLFELTLIDRALLQGGYDLILWTGGMGEDFTSFLVGEEGVLRPEDSVLLTLSLGPVAAPEPKTVLLLALGLAGLAVFRRQRRAGVRSIRIPVVSGLRERGRPGSY